MEVQVSAIQWLGICLTFVGLTLNSTIFIFTYYKILAVIQMEEEERERDKDKSFPIIRMVFRFRAVLKELAEKQDKRNFELIVVFIKWTLMIAVLMTVLGILLFLIGFMI